MKEFLKKEKNLSIQQIKQIEMLSTIQTCKEVNLQNRLITLETFDEYNLASLLMGLALEIVEIAKHLKINPFFQEMVEKRKIISLKMLNS